MPKGPSIAGQNLKARQRKPEMLLRLVSKAKSRRPLERSRRNLALLAITLPLKVCLYQYAAVKVKRNPPQNQRAEEIDKLKWAELRDLGARNHLGFPVAKSCKKSKKSL